MPDDFYDKTLAQSSPSAPATPVNHSTRVVLLRDLERQPRTLNEVSAIIKAPAEQLFEYAKGIQTPGLAYALVDLTHRVRSLQHVAAARFRGTSVVFGRHSHTDSPTDANNVALRHLVITQRLTEPHAAEVRDLRSVAGTRTITGGRVHTARIQAPFALDLNDIFVVACATPLTLDQTAFLQRVMTPVISPLMPSLPTIGLRLERFKKMDGPGKSAGFSFMDDDPEQQVALRLEEMLDVTPTAEQLLHGYMIGRYSRCNWPGHADGTPSGLSRVHAMVFASQGAAYIADTGSTNGVRHMTLGALRYKHLELGDQFWLGKACRLTVIEPREPLSKLQA